MDDNDRLVMIGSVLDDMSDGVLLIGFDGKIQLINRAASQMLSLSGGGSVGRTIAQIMNETEENDIFFEAMMDAVYTKSKIVKTIPFVRQDELAYLRITSDFLMNGTEKIGVIMQISDISKATMLFIANKRLANQVTDLMNSFVEVMVTAVEEKSAYNANHTKSMVQYAKRYLNWLAEEGTLTNYTSENTLPFLMSIWLHDIGKLLVPQEIMDKPTRLGASLETVSHRIETAKLMLRIQMLENPETRKETEYQLQRLCEAEELIVSSNTADFLDDETVGRLHQASKIQCLASDGTLHSLLNDKELEAISVRRGTLTADERRIIESHVVLTDKLLSKVEFRGIYQSVHKWAAGHHELLDGSGYPGHLQGNAIPWETRLLTILDIYDALTAEDRPYKPPLPPEKAFTIMRDMASNGKIDAGILESFYASNAWKHNG